MDNDTAQRISDLQNAKSALFQQCEALEAENEEMEAEKASLQARVEELEGDNLDLIGQVQGLTEELGEAEQTIGQLETVKRVGRVSQDEKDSKGS